MWFNRQISVYRECEEHEHGQWIAQVSLPRGRFPTHLCGENKKKKAATANEWQQQMTVQCNHCGRNPTESSLFSQSHPVRSACSGPFGTLFSSPPCSAWPSMTYCRLQSDNSRDKKSISQLYTESSENSRGVCSWWPSYSSVSSRVSLPQMWCSSECLLHLQITEENNKRTN